jgi:hypothetical protein
VKNKMKVAFISIIWLALTGFLAYKGFFLRTNMPPGLLLGLLPPIVMIVLSLATRSGKKFISSLNLGKLTLLHTIRIPVEIILFFLSANKLVPELMTFSGRNFDIISGITAPLAYFICFRGGQLKNRRLLLAWNFLCLGLLLNILINAILAAPFPFQQFAFEQPNVAVLHFPFVWLPVFIVVIVLFSHLAAIRLLLSKHEFTVRPTFVISQ